MKKLHEVTQLIRSKNAGPFMMTIDIIFPDQETYFQVLETGAMDVDKVAERLQVNPELLKRYELPLANAIKYSMPREVPCGDFLDEDLYGCQYHRRLVEYEIPLN